MLGWLASRSAARSASPSSSPGWRALSPARRRPLCLCRATAFGAAPRLHRAVELLDLDWVDQRGARDRRGQLSVASRRRWRRARARRAGRDRLRLAAHRGQLPQRARAPAASRSITASSSSCPLLAAIVVAASCSAGGGATVAVAPAPDLAARRSTRAAALDPLGDARLRMRHVAARPGADPGAQRPARDPDRHLDHRPHLSVAARRRFPAAAAGEVAASSNAPFADVRQRIIGAPARRRWSRCSPRSAAWARSTAGSCCRANCRSRWRGAASSPPGSAS